MPFKSTLGIQVDRAAAADPQNVWLPIFTIAGGLVLVKMLWGVRTVIQAGGASNMQFRHSVPPTVLCAAAAIGGNDVNTVYNITGNFADALQIGVVGAPSIAGIAGGLLATGINMIGLLMFTGDIEVTMTAAAGTGSTGYSLIYIPLTAGATIVAA